MGFDTCSCKILVTELPHFRAGFDQSKDFRFRRPESQVNNALIRLSVKIISVANYSNFFVYIHCKFFKFLHLQ